MLPKIRFVNTVCVYILILVFIQNGSYAQIKPQKLIALYRNQQFDQIKQMLTKASPNDTSGTTYLFFKTLFLRNGAQARKNYETVFKQSENPLKQLAAQRLHDYYYALGLYFKASQYQNETLTKSGEKTKAKPATHNLFSEKSPFEIQFGAFSRKANAELQAKKLTKQNIRARVVKRKINNKPFFCVWVNGLKNIEETQKFAEQIKKQIHLDYRIIKP